jgi:hypothetical protein
MKSSTKFWLAFFTFLPVICIFILLALFFTVFFEQIIALENHHGEFPTSLIPSLLGFTFIIIILAFVSLGTKIYYLVHVNNQTENDTNKRVLWTLILIFTGLIGSIVYYFVEIVPIKKIE